MRPLERGGLRARVAAGAADGAALLALRQAAFPRTDGRPEMWEPLDDLCCHVLVETVEGLPLAGFRVRVFADGRALDDSYSARFYDLAPLAAVARPLAEMGRFCLSPGPLAPDALRLAWGAMTRIVETSGAGMMIGCASFAGADWPRHRAALALLAEAHLGPPAQRPRERAAEVVPYPALAGACGDPRRAMAGLPPLLRSYLAMGGWVSDHAVADRLLDTLHVFTCVEIDRIPPARAARLRALAADPGG